jgi:peptide/nickel transport system ATP-binding protein
MSEQQAPLVSVRDLRKHYPLNGGLLRKGAAVKAVDGVSFDIQPGETFGLVGSPAAEIHPRARHPAPFRYHLGRDPLCRAGDRPRPRKELKPLRKRMQAIFQDPSSLNPG